MKYSSNGDRLLARPKTTGKLGIYVAWLVALLMLVAAIAGPPAINFGYSPRTYNARHVSRSHGYGRSNDFYTLLRWVCCSVFAFSAFTAFHTKRTAWVWIFGALAVLFNPLAPVYLQRATWKLIDSASIGVIVVAAIAFWRTIPKKLNE